MTVFAQNLTVFIPNTIVFDPDMTVFASLAPNTKKLLK